jgi:CHASE3 domain sensor protein
MKFKECMQFVLGLFKELLTLLRISQEKKQREIELKNTEDFKKAAENQSVVTQKDKDEEVIGRVVNSKSEEDKKAALDEIRRVIAK